MPEESTNEHTACDFCYQTRRRCVKLSDGAGVQRTRSGQSSSGLRGGSLTSRANSAAPILSQGGAQSLSRRRGRSVMSRASSNGCSQVSGQRSHSRGGRAAISRASSIGCSQVSGNRSQSRGRGAGRSPTMSGHMPSTGVSPKVKKRNRKNKSKASCTVNPRAGLPGGWCLVLMYVPWTHTLPPPAPPVLYVPLITETMPSLPPSIPPEVITKLQNQVQTLTLRQMAAERETEILRHTVMALQAEIGGVHLVTFR